MRDELVVTVADIALVGLGEIGGRFLDEILKLEERGINIVCAAQNSETQGKQRAREAGIPLMTLDEIIDLGPAVDVIFDLTGDPGVRRYLRMRMQKTGNCHTIVAPETLARMLWAVISDEDLGDKHGAGGYR